MNILNHRIDLAPQGRSLLGIMLAAVGVTLLVTVVSTAMPNRDTVLPDAPGAAALPSAPVTATTPPETGVPDAATVFRGQHVALPEDAPPTF